MAWTLQHTTVPPSWEKNLSFLQDSPWAKDGAGSEHTSQAWPQKPLATATGHVGQSGPSHGFLCLFPLELLQLADFGGKWPELSILHRVQDYRKDGERFQTRLFGPLDPAMPEAAPPPVFSVRTQ